MICTDAHKENCNKDNAVCAVENFNPKCICTDETSIYPHCQKVSVCEENCNGNCIIINGKKECICIHGGVPPLCQIIPPLCQGVHCGFGNCIVGSDSKPYCECLNGGGKCGKNSRCSVQGDCECERGRLPNCRPVCRKKCKKGSTCKYDYEENREKCVCNYAGKYPNCEVCTKTCKEGTQCFRDEDGNDQCLCPGNLQRSCPIKCSKKCARGRCVIANGKEICVCHDGSKNYPSCNGPCSKKDCKFGKCIIENGGAKCVCMDNQENYPECNLCASKTLDCESNGGFCSNNDDGISECFCKNGWHNYPICDDESKCNCPTNTECVIAGNKSF